MALIDHTFFVGELNIPNTHRPDVQERLLWFIKKYEPEFLNAVLGAPLYAAFQTGIAAAEPEAVWTVLKNALMHVDGDFKYSPIANYVYYWYMRDQATITTGVGEAKPNVDHAAPAESAQKMVRAWNEMSAQVTSLHTLLNQSASLYPDLDYRYIRGHAPINSFNL